MTGHRRSGRRTNAERTATTRARLLDATLACLAERGYAGTTTTEVSRRSGVSRGALLHHFPSRQALVLAAVEHVIDRRIEELRAVASRVPLGADRVDMTIDLLWATMRGPSFSASFELVAAARTDADLRPAVGRLSERLEQGVATAAIELFPPPDDAAEVYRFEVVVRLVFAVLYGLAFECFSGPPASEVNAAAVLLLLKRIVRLFDASTRVPEVRALLGVLLADGHPVLAGAGGSGLDAALVDALGASAADRADDAADGAASPAPAGSVSDGPPSET